MTLTSFRLIIWLVLVVGLLAACGRGGSETASLTLSPTSTTVSAGGHSIAFAATLRNSESEIRWTLSSAVGTLSHTSGPATVYEPPAYLESNITVILTARAGDITAAASINVQAGGTPQPSLTVNPKTRNVNAGDAPFLIQAQLQNSVDPITWSMTGPGAIDTTSGPTVTYTPPGSLSATAVATITATAGSLTDTATITVEQGATITVSGRAFSIHGAPVENVYVQIDDAAGRTFGSLGAWNDGAGTVPLITTEPDGTFMVSGVTPPYTLSVVPTDGMAESWTGITRPDPTLAVHSYFSTSKSCGFEYGGLTYFSTTPIDTDNYWRAYFVGEGLEHQEAMFLSDLMEGDGSGSMTLEFKGTPCVREIEGKLIAVEFDANDEVVSSGIRDVTVAAGDTNHTSVTLSNTQTELISGRVEFQAGTSQAEIYVLMKVGGASVFLNTVSGAILVDALNPTFQITVPRLDGVEYRVLAVAGGIFGNYVQWAYSDVISTPGSNVVLNLPSPVSAVSPAGGIGTQTTPIFKQAPVTGANLYYSRASDGQFLGGLMWAGVSGTPEVEMPLLPAPAQLLVGSDVAPNEYWWLADYALNIRDGGSADVMLDGRLVGGNMLHGWALFYPDTISAGSSTDADSTYFSLP